MSIRTRATPNRAPDSQRADAPLVLAFGRGWRGEEGLETPPGLAEARRSLRSYVFGRRQRGPIVIREEGVGSGPRPGPARSYRRRIRASVRPCWESLEIGVGRSARLFVFLLFVYLFIYFGMGWRSPEPSLVAAEWKFGAPAGPLDFWGFRGSAEGGTIHRFRNRRRAPVRGRDPTVVGSGRFLQALDAERWPSGSFGSPFELLGFLVAFCFCESVCVSFSFFWGGVVLFLFEPLGC